MEHVVGGALLGKQLLPRQIAGYGRPHWEKFELVKFVATMLGESLGFVGAYNDNSNGTRDCGLPQINIPNAEVGTSIEASLRTESLDPLVYDPVVKTSVLAAYRLYEQPGSNTGLRRWEPWAAYTSGWAPFPFWWTWKHVAGVGTGPWVPTGRYLQKAIVGVSNYHLLLAKDMTLEQALALAVANQKHFEVEGELGITHAMINWTKVPGAPSMPPSDGEGPRPEENSGA